MADDIVVRLKRELEEIRRSGYGHDWPLSQAIAVIEAQQAEIERLRAAGDVLAHLMPSCFSVPCRSPQGTPLNEWCSECAALVAWKKARRG